jgi:hypothetical protein
MFELSSDNWADIMHDSTGKCYAIYAEGELTKQNECCIYVEINREDCPQAYDEAQAHF